MTERTAIYDVGGGIVTIEQFKRLPCALPCAHPDYRPPTPDEVDLLTRLAGWSQRELALITGVRQSSKGSPTVRRWKTPVGDKEHRQIPAATWQYLLEYVGIESVKETKEVLKKHYSFLMK